MPGHFLEKNLSSWDIMRVPHPQLSNRSSSTSGGSEELTPLTTIHNSNATTSNAAASAGTGNTTWLTAENAVSVVVGSEI